MTPQSDFLTSGFRYDADFEVLSLDQFAKDYHHQQRFQPHLLLDLQVLHYPQEIFLQEEQPCEFEQSYNTIHVTDKT